MNRLLSTLIASGLLAGAASHPAQAGDENEATRVKEMLRRTQEALRLAQSENAELAKTKSAAEQKLLEATRQVEGLQSGSKAVAAAMTAKLSSAQGAQAEVSRRLAEANQRYAELAAKQADTANGLAQRQAELAESKKQLEDSVAANGVCENKNLTLYGYANSLLFKYQHKGVWTALAQKEPVFGLKEVDVENVVQEYKLKFDGQKVKP